MATYTISRRDNHSGFEVQVIGDDGAHQTLLGFRTRVEAHEWIAQDRKSTDLVKEDEAHVPPTEGGSPTGQSPPS
jgi:hypothetical protein